MVEYSRTENLYRTLANIAKGVGMGLTAIGVIMQDPENIGGGVGITYIANTYLQTTHREAVDRQQTDILRTIEGHLNNDPKTPKPPHLV